MLRFTQAGRIGGAGRGAGGGGGRGGAARLRGRRRCRRGCRRVLVVRLVLPPAQVVDVLLVLAVVFREDVAAIPVGDEVQLLGARRIGGGFHGGDAPIGR